VDAQGAEFTFKKSREDAKAKPVATASV